MREYIMAGINSNNYNPRIKTNMSQQKITTYTRPLGGNKPSVGGLNPFDTQSVRIGRNSGLRTGLNRGLGGAGDKGIFYQAQQAGYYGNNGMDTMAKIAAYSQLGMQAGKMLTDIIGTFKGANPSGNVTDGLGDAGGVQSTAISNMRSAKDSVSLRAAIQDAQGELQTKQAEHAQLRGSYDEAKESLSTKKKEIEQGKNKLKDLQQTQRAKESDVTKKESALNLAKDAYGNATQNLSNSQKQYAFAKQATIEAQGNLDRATNDFNTASQNYDSAKQAYESCPSDSPNKGALQVQMQQAETAKNAAEQRKTEAENQLKEKQELEQQAKQAVDGAQEEVNQADEQMKSAEDGLKKAEKDLTDAKKAAEDAKKDVEKQKSDLEQKENELQEMENTIKTYEDGEKSITNLQKEITSQNERLTQLIEQEKNQESDLDTKIQKKQERLDNKKSGGSKLSDTISSLISKQDPIQRRNDITALLQKPGINTEHGVLRSTIDRNGQPIYMLDSHEISAEEYNKYKQKPEESS